VSESKVVLFVGRIQRLKGLDILVRSFHNMLQVQPDLDVRLVVVGGLPVGTKGRSTHEGREITRVQKIATRLGLAERITWVGAVPQERLPLYYQAADVTVMPSSYESFGLVAVESLASGTPVVASRVGGLTTIVGDGENGFLVPWRDPAMFAERIREVLIDAPLRDRLAANARRSVEQFGWDRIATQHVEVYEDVIAARQHSLATASLRSG
jgi:D-inositol-3-phosphate glycosyltransferase